MRPLPPFIFSRSHSRKIAGKADAPPRGEALSIGELEEGLRVLDQGEIEPEVFWNDNLAAFRDTLLVAIRETSDALSTPRLSPELRAEFEAQLPALRYYLVVADRQLDSLGRGHDTNVSRKLPCSIN